MVFLAEPKLNSILIIKTYLRTGLQLKGTIQIPLKRRVMPFECTSFQEKWMEKLNLRLGSSDYMKYIRYACHA